MPHATPMFVLAILAASAVLLAGLVVFNTGLNFKQFRDDRARTLEQQIDDPVQSPLEMASLWPDVVARLYRDRDYPQRFRKLYPESISRDSIRNAIAGFMRSLTTPNGHFDRWLQGDEGALDPVEKHGYPLFKYCGGASCHQGANVAGANSSTLAPNASRVCYGRTGL